jgi:hypothetical protein
VGVFILKTNIYVTTKNSDFAVTVLVIRITWTSYYTLHLFTRKAVILVFDFCSHTHKPFRWTHLSDDIHVYILFYNYYYRAIVLFDIYFSAETF